MDLLDKIDMFINEEAGQYAAVLIGGEMDGKRIKSVKDLRGMDASKYVDTEDMFVDAKEAEARRKKLQSMLKPNRQAADHHKGMSYKLVKVKNGKFTGE